MIIGLLAGLAGQVFSRGQEPEPAGAANPAAAAQPTSMTLLAYIGSASCAASACHGGTGGQNGIGSEFTLVAGNDPHAGAYNVLTDEPARRMVRLYRGLKAVGDARPDQDSLCLACHVLPGFETRRRTESFTASEGVGCEACHGPAEKWLAVHHLPEWKNGKISPAEKRSLGMLPTRELASRAHGCVGCHVGTPQAAVDHELLAAGHPRLAFEFGAYHANLPKHWRETGPNTNPDFEVRAWLLGQVVTTTTALELLAHRTKATAQPWPELAEFNCFACHHDLAAPSWRRARINLGSFPGAILPAEWYTAPLRMLAGGRRRSLPAIGETLETLHGLLARPSPDRSAIAARAGAAATQLAAALPGLDTVPFRSDELHELIAALLKQAPAAATNWDQAAQLYLALAALAPTRTALAGASRDPKVAAALREVFTALDFPSGNSVRYNSPQQFRPDSVRQAFDRLRTVLEQ